MIRRSIERKEEEKRRCIEARKLGRKIEEKGRGAPKGREGEEKRERDERGEGRRENSFSRRMRVDLRADSHQRIGHDLGSP